MYMNEIKNYEVLLLNLPQVTNTLINTTASELDCHVS